VKYKRVQFGQHAGVIQGSPPVKYKRVQFGQHAGADNWRYMTAELSCVTASIRRRFTYKWDDMNTLTTRGELSV